MSRRPVCRVGGGAGARRLRGARGDRGGVGFGAENERLRAENERLRGQVEELRRASRRQAAPFSKGDPKAAPARPGRKAGEGYGTKARRPVPDHIDEEIDVPLPDGCPCCGGELEFEGHSDQYQEDVVTVRTHVRRYRVARGRCRRCGRRAQGRHPEQTSDALGAAGAQIGPRAVALAAHLNKELGLPVAKAARVLSELCGLEVTAGGLHQALARLAAAAAPTYLALADGVRNSPAVAADETGWRVSGRRQWLWVFVGDGVTVYLIAPGRGYEQACRVLGAGFSGVLERDGWAPYRRFQDASHQTCLAHLLRRASELIADSVAGQARIPHAVRRLLHDALAVRDRHSGLLAGRGAQADVIDGETVEIDCAPRAPGARTAPLALPAPAGENATAASDGEVVEGDISEAKEPEAADREIIKVEAVEGEVLDGDAQSLVAARADLHARFDALLARDPTHAPNRKLLKHLANERDHLLTFLETHGVQATNWRAEQAIRPAVINRKHWGGNRTPRGADTQQTLMSVIRTARQRDACPVALLIDLQRHPDPQVAGALRLPAARQPTATQAPSQPANGP